MNLLQLGKSCLKRQYLDVDLKAKGSFVKTWGERASSRIIASTMVPREGSSVLPENCIYCKQERRGPIISKSWAGIRVRRGTGHRNDHIFPCEMEAEKL